MSHRAISLRSVRDVGYTYSVYRLTDVLKSRKTESNIIRSAVMVHMPLLFQQETGLEFD